MNIFVLDENPMLAARYQCNKHIVKMPLETAQLLCSPFSEAPYKRTHYNHPCAKWVRRSLDNFVWAFEHGIYLCEEYTRRYKRTHKSEDVIKWCAININQLTFEVDTQTPFELCMPDYVKTIDNPVKSYRDYYKLEKKDIAVWPEDKTPFWWN